MRSCPSQRSHQLPSAHPIPPPPGAAEEAIVVFVTFQAVVTPPGISRSPWEGFKCCQSAGQASGVEKCVGIGAGTGASAGTDAISKFGAQETP